MDASLAAAVNILLVAIATDGWTRQDLTTAWSVLPLTSSWPHLIGLEELMLTELSLCYSIVYYYNGAQRYEQFLEVGQRILLALVFVVQYLFNSFCYIVIYFSVSWALWDWPLIWLTNDRPSVLWHCWLGILGPRNDLYYVDWAIKSYYSSKLQLDVVTAVRGGASWWTWMKAKGRHGVVCRINCVIHVWAPWGRDTCHLGRYRNPRTFTFLYLYTQQVICANVPSAEVFLNDTTISAD